MSDLTHAISGFARALAGEELGYRSFHPYATDALLVRCLDDRHPILWETEPLPADARPDAEGFLHFVWVAAHSSGTSAADATFTLELDGEAVLSFTTVQSRRVRKWSVEGRNGLRLSFEAMWEDSVADLFGYMHLRVPAQRVCVGKPLRLGLRGAASQRRDWAMTFKYVLRDSVALQPQPALLATPQGPRQLVHALLDVLEGESRATLTVPGQEPQEAPLRLGFNRIAFHLPPVEEPTPFTITLARQGHHDHVESLLLEPVIRRELWILPHSHVDVGYSDLQVDVERKQLHNLRVAVEEHRRTAGYPPEARSAWNTEIAWPVERYLAQATPAEREELFQVMREGGIGLNAFFTNPLTGICRPEELLRLTEDARRIGREAGVEVRDAMITDIPGSSWATVTALARSGIRWYSSGPNYNPGLTGGGDRVGHFNSQWGDKPFWWRSASGLERVLCWVAGKGYSAFHGSALRWEDSGSATRLLDYLRELDEGDYPYDMVQLRYTIGGDNGPVDPELPDYVRRWNESYLTPRLRLATCSTLFAEFERRWGHALPEFQGEISPYWEDGALSTLRELSLARRASERLLQAETLACLLPGVAIPPARWDEAWRLQHLADEHTWGAWNSVSEADCDFVREQWRVKRGYMEGVDAASRALVRELLPEDVDGDRVEVVNTCSWPRTDLVVVDAPQAAVVVRDGEGALLPCQRMSDGGLAFVAWQVPALGARRYELQAGASGDGHPAPADAVRVGDAWLDNGLVQLRIDIRTGALASLRDAGGREWVGEADGLNRYLRVVGVDPPVQEHAAVLRVEVVEPGPVVGLVRVHLQAAGCRALTVDYRLVAGLERVDVINRLDREDVREKEAIHFRFPLDLDGGSWRQDGGWTVLEPLRDQLPGSCRDFLCSGRWLDCSTATHGLTCTTVDTPLMEPGLPVDESPDAQGRRQWRRDLAPGSTFHTYAMNNAWHTNYAAAQPGPASLEHRLHPHGAFDACAAFRHGVEAGQPLLTRRVESSRPRVESPFRLANDQLLISALKPCRQGGGSLLRLFNPTGMAQELRLEWCGPPARLRVCEVDEAEGEPLESGRMLAPGELLMLRLDWD